MMIAYCGLDCQECPVYVATRTNDDELRLETALEWSELYAEHIGVQALKLEEMNCEGCRTSSGGRLFVGCRNCPLRACGRQRKVSTCAACEGYGECEMLAGFLAQVPEAAANLERFRAGLGKAR
jgi:hypothetical protein